MSKEHWGDGGVYLRGKTWWIFYPRDGRTVRESSKSSDKSVAHKLRRKRIAESRGALAGGPTIDRITISELLDDLLRDYEIKGKTLWWAKLNVEKHVRPYFKYTKAARLTTGDVEKYILEKRSEGYEDSTINRHLALLRRAFKLGAKASPSKVGRIPVIEGLDESANVRAGFFEDEDYQRLLLELPPELKPVATFAYYTGCRKGELLSLKWDQVDLEGGMVRLKSGTTKNKEPRMIPLAPEVVAALETLKAQRDQYWAWSAWVFSRSGQRIKSMYGAWRSACKRAGLEANALLHDMRRTGVRNLVRAGVPERVAMQISGHKTREVFDRYNITSEADLKKAAQQVHKHIAAKRRKK